MARLETLISPEREQREFVNGLKCGSCNHSFPDQATYVCPDCVAPGLEVSYDYDGLKTYIARQGEWLRPEHSMWRYASLLPCRELPRVGFYTGMTPLVEAKNLGRAIGAERLYLKDDSVNRPTLSYKDRVVSTAVNKALEFGFEAVGCVSTGNVSNSVSALAAEAGLPAFVVVPQNTEKGKLIGSLIYGAKVIVVRGNYDEANNLCKQLAQVNKNLGFANINLRSYYSEGAKSLVYEMAEELGWRLPRHIILPLAGATLLIKTAKAITELQTLGLIDSSPVKIYGAQAQGSAPIANAFEANADSITPVTPNTVASSLAIGNPGDGMAALRAVRNTGGKIGYVSDSEIIEGMKLLARTEGIFAEAAGGTTVGFAKKLFEQKLIPPDEETVVVITGNGYKTPDPVLGSLSRIEEVDYNLDQLRQAVNF